MPSIDFTDAVTTVYMQRFSIDTLKLGEWMAKNKGWNSKKESLHFFIKREYGEDAEAFVSANL